MNDVPDSLIIPEHEIPEEFRGKDLDYSYLEEKDYKAVLSAIRGS